MKLFLSLFLVVILLSGCFHDQKEDSPTTNQPEETLNQNIKSEVEDVNINQKITPVLDEKIESEPEKPQDKQILSVQSGVWKSIDGGKTWEHKNIFSSARPHLNDFSDVEIEKIILDPIEPGRIYLASEENGVFESNNHGDLWIQKDFLRGLKIRGIAVGLNNAMVYVTTNDNKLYKTGNYWMTLDNIYSYSNDQVNFTDVATDYSNPWVVYLSTGDGKLLKSKHSEGKQIWETACQSERGAFVDVIIDPKDPRIVYIATRKEGMYKLVDGDCKNIGSGSVNFYYNDLLIGGNNLFLVSRYGISKSTNSGTSWQKLSLPTSEEIYSAAINPKDSNNIYFGTRGYLYESNDAGISWNKTKWPFSRLAHRIVIDPNNPEIIYIAIINR